MSAIGYGTLFKQATTSIGKVLSVSGPGMAGAAVDTSHAETTDAFRTFVPGMVDAGEVTLSLMFDKASATTIHGWWRTSQAYSITFSDGSVWAFNGFLTGFSHEVTDLDGVVTANLTFKVTGKPGWTAAT